MTSRSRLIVLLISTPVILLVVVGGVLSRAMGREESYGPMKTFDEVVTLILNNYVESVEPDRIMQGAIGVELTRQYWVRVISAREGSPAAKAGLRTGDFIRAIDDQPTREMSAWTGARLLRGAPG